MADTNCDTVELDSRHHQQQQQQQQQPQPSLSADTADSMTDSSNIRDNSNNTGNVAQPPPPLVSSVTAVAAAASPEQVDRLHSPPPPPPPAPVAAVDDRCGGGAQQQQQLVEQLVTRRQLLAHETEQLLQLLEEDALLVAARGLCWERLLVALLHVYRRSCWPGAAGAAGALVLVIGAGVAETQQLVRQLEHFGRQEAAGGAAAADSGGGGAEGAVRVMTATETPPAERQRLYRAGGVAFVTSRLLLLDLLTGRCDAALITGVVVCGAHTVLDSAQEAFILRLYRQQNKTGFIKAFSAHAVAFTAGFCQVERVMRALFVRRLLLWPRFHVQIRDSLSACSPDVVELHVTMGDKMAAIHMALLSLISITVREFRRINKSLECAELTVESAVAAGFERVLRGRIDPAWHQLSSYGRQLVTDLRTLRALLVALLHDDCCTFYQQVAAVQSGEASAVSSWSLLDEAETLFVEARRRVFGTSSSSSSAASSSRSRRVLTLEVPPKCTALADVLDEISTDLSTADAATKCGAGGECGAASGRHTVVLLARQRSTCYFLRRFVRDGAQSALWHRYLTCLAPKFGGSDTFAPNLGDSATSSSAATNTSAKKASAEVSEETEEGGDDGVPELLWTGNIRLLFMALKNADRPFQLRLCLQKWQPRFVVLYEMDVTTIRTLEVYQACYPECPLRVYTLLLSGTAEEQSYLTELRVEKEAFEFLVRQKEQMVVPEEREARQDDFVFEDLAPAEVAGAAGSSSRRGGAPAPAPATARQRPCVIVDTREFRCQLPTLLHRRGLHIVPATIEVGDYIVTPHVCVERKSVSDLIGSLMSGRLYTQTENMVRHYRTPILLVEFDQHRPFNLQRGLYVSSDISCDQLMSRLQLLTLHFPQLRLAWCPSPLASAQLLHQLKQNADEPSVEQARALTTDSDAALNDERFHPQIRNFVSKLPGVNAKNLFALLNRVKTLADLTTLSKEDMCDLMTAENGARLYDAIHCQLGPPAAGSGAVSRTGKRPAAPGTKSKQRSTRPRFWPHAK